jgi:hypothetical protein
MTKTLILRTSDHDRKAHNGFQWPASGVVECPDWNPRAECGNGLHGIRWPEGDWSDIKNYENPVWQVVAVEESTLVAIGGKVKFPRGEVVYSGEFAIAFNMVAKAWLATIPQMIAEIHPECDGVSSSSGDYSRLAASGDYSQLAASGARSRLDVTGENSVVACAGSVAAYKAAAGGCIAAPWHDGTRIRFAVGYIGETLDADTWYTVNVNGEFEKI